MPSVDWSAIGNVDDFRTGLQRKRSNLVSVMNDQRTLIEGGLDSAKIEADKAAKVLNDEQATLPPSTWSSDAASRAQALVNDLREKSQQHLEQRKPHFEMLDTTTAELSQVWNS